MKIINKTLGSIGGKIEVTTDGNLLITVPPVDANGYTVVRVDASGLKTPTTASMIAFIEDRSDDEAKFQELLVQVLAIQAELTDMENPVTEARKAILYAEFANLSEQIKKITGLAITDII